MTLANSTLQHTVDLYRVLYNQLVFVYNLVKEGKHYTSGTLQINPADQDNVSLNVVNGFIRGNAAYVNSLNTLSFTRGTLTNSQLQNSYLNITTTGGVAGGDNVHFGGTLNLTMNNVVDSTQNARTDLPVSANAVNSIPLYIVRSAENVTTGIISSAYGGTGFSNTYSNGQMLIGDGVSNLLSRSVPVPGSGGISIQNTKTTLVISSNIMAGQGIVRANTGGFVFSANLSTNTQVGITQLNDTITSTALSEAGTANAVNTLSDLLGPINTLSTAASDFAASVNISGRLISTQRFTANGTWTKASNASFVVVEVQAAGAAGGGARRSGQIPSGTASLGSGGGAGAYALCLINASELTSTVNVIVGLKGVGVSASDGTAGQQSRFGSYVVCLGGEPGQNENLDDNEAIDGGVGGSVSSTTGIILRSIDGQRGGPGYWLTDGGGFGQDLQHTGAGGDSPLGTGGSVRMAAYPDYQGMNLGGEQGTSNLPDDDAHGDDGKGYGSGGSGGSQRLVNTSYRGGDGADGVVIIHTYGSN